MSTAKIIEVVAEGSTVEGAVQAVVDEASKTIKNIKGVKIKNFQAVVEGNKIKKYRVDAKVSFVVER